MVKKYIDFDGVIKDTYKVLFADYNNNISDTEHVIKKDWIYVLKNSPIINNAVKVINELDNVAICTKIHSLENEGVAKIKDIRDIGINCDIILVPYQVKKTDVVNARGNILVDDALFNLDEWYLAGGIPIFFDNNNSNIDNYGKENKKYVRTKSLELLKKY